MATAGYEIVIKWYNNKLNTSQFTYINSDHCLKARDVCGDGEDII